MNKNVIVSDILLEKFVHGGQCISQLPDGKRLLVWGGLPEELVDVRIIKNKNSYAEGIVENVVKPNPNRIEPLEPDSFLSTSPWQIVDYELENKSKQEILSETFKREGINVYWHEFYSDKQQYGYRNKIEIGFWGDEEGLHLAHFARGTHGKVKVTENKLAKECLNVAALAIRDELSKMNIWAGKLKTLILRCNQNDEVVGALFVKDNIDFSSFELPKELKGLDVYYSDPKSPASIPTKLIKRYKTTDLIDIVNGKDFRYNVLSFFQVNIPVFMRALNDIKVHIENKNTYKVVDMYSGVGSIGLSVGANIIVESDFVNITYSKKNAGKATKTIHANSEEALEFITGDSTLIVDPPRAGLHKKVVEKINEAKPKKVVYLSCNPVTQARDLKMLGEKYKITYARGYNFFPHTPHIETLLVLNRI